MSAGYQVATLAATCVATDAAQGPWQPIEDCCFFCARNLSRHPDLDLRLTTRWRHQQPGCRSAGAPAGRYPRAARQRGDSAMLTGRSSCSDSGSRSHAPLHTQHFIPRLLHGTCDIAYNSMPCCIRTHNMDKAWVWNIYKRHSGIKQLTICHDLTRPNNVRLVPHEYDSRLSACRRTLYINILQQQHGVLVGAAVCHREDNDVSIHIIVVANVLQLSIDWRIDLFDWLIYLLTDTFSCKKRGRAVNLNNKHFC